MPPVNETASAAAQNAAEANDAIDDLEERVRELGVERVKADAKAEALTKSFDDHVSANEGSFNSVATGIRGLKEKFELLEADGSPVARILKGMEGENESPIVLPKIDRDMEPVPQRKPKSEAAPKKTEPKGVKPSMEYVTPSSIASASEKKAPAFPPEIANDPERPTHVRCTCGKDHEITGARFNARTGYYDMVWQDGGRCAHKDGTLCTSTGFVRKN